MKIYLKKLMVCALALLLIFENTVKANALVLDTKREESNLVDTIELETVNSSGEITVYRGQTRSMVVNLPNYIGFNKEFYINATTSITEGEIWLTLLDPHKTVMFYKMVIGPNDATKIKYFLPLSGDWTLSVTAVDTATPVTVKAGWN